MAISVLGAGFGYDDHATPTWFEGRGDAAFAERGCLGGGGGGNG